MRLKSYSVPRVLSEVLRPIHHEPFASEKVNPVGYALRIDLLTSAFLEILVFLEALAVFHACLVHLAGLLAQGWVFLVVRLEIPFPYALDNLRHFYNYGSN